jgi:hypothetical protein
MDSELQLDSEAEHHQRQRNHHHHLSQQQQQEAYYEQNDRRSHECESAILKKDLFLRSSMQICKFDGHHTKARLVNYFLM